MAETKASCAISSATPMSRTRRVKPAMSLGDSMRQMASSVRCVSVGKRLPKTLVAIAVTLAKEGSKLFGFRDLPNFDFFAVLKWAA